MRVFVVTGLKLGWDCVVAVYDADSVSEEDLRSRYPEGEYVISETAYLSELSMYLIIDAPGDGNIAVHGDSQYGEGRTLRLAIDDAMSK